MHPRQWQSPFQWQSPARSHPLIAGVQPSRLYSRVACAARYYLSHAGLSKPVFDSGN